MAERLRFVLGGDPDRAGRQREHHAAHAEVDLGLGLRLAGAPLDQRHAGRCVDLRRRSNAGGPISVTQMT